MTDPSTFVHQTIRPSLALMPYIDQYWHRQGYMEDEEIITLMPDGSTHLIINLGEAITSLDSGKEIGHEKMYMVGPMARTDTQVIRGCFNLFGVQLKPGAFSHFFPDMPLQWLTNQFEEYPWRDSPDFGQVIKNFASAMDRFFLQRLMHPSLPIMPVLEHIQQCKGQIRVHQLVRHHFLSERQLERQFLKQAGLSPKEYIRLVRFNHALSKIQLRSGQSLAEIASACGYYDQAHFTHEFRRYTQQLPGSFILSDFSKTAAG